MKNQQLIDLGTVAVMGELKTGKYIEFSDGKVICIQEIVGKHTYTRAVTGMELFRYRLKQFLKNWTMPVVGGLVVMVILLIAHRLFV